MSAPQYLAIIGDVDGGITDLLTRSNALPMFERRVEHPTLTVMTAEDTDFVDLPGQPALVVGKLFDRGATPQRVMSFSDSHARLLRSGGGQTMFTSYWGSYVGFFVDQNTGAVSLVRDPSGAVPCYHVRHRGADIIFSDIDLLVEAGLYKPKVDWESLAFWLNSGNLRIERPAVHGITEILPGSSLTSRCRELNRELGWTPWSWVEQRCDETDAVLAERLREAIQGCTAAWASSFDSILLALSGGLDSSILAACLASTSTPIHCMTFATSEADGDERTYARQVAEALGIHLYEEMYDVRDIDLDISLSAHLPRPASHPYGQSVDTIQRRLAYAHGVDGFFDGTGGDNAFCFLRSASPIVDRAKAEGLSTGLSRTITDVCRLNQCSAVSAIRMALRRAKRAPDYHWRATERFLVLDAANAEFTGLHPWLSAPTGALPGKAAHIAMLLQAQNAFEAAPRGKAPPTVSPLLSQPIVELCLSIPSWRWCGGGRARSLARLAFSHALPPEIISRRSKGGPDSFCIETIESRRRELLDRFEGGLLARNGIIDLCGIKRVLDDPRPLRSPDHIRLSALADAETWARGWAAQS